MEASQEKRKRGDMRTENKFRNALRLELICLEVKGQRLVYRPARRAAAAKSRGLAASWPLRPSTA